MHNNKKQVIVIGGGAAGIVAAISAARLGANVTILERNLRIGKKILATGNGRCNFTNINTSVDNYYGDNPDFVESVLNQFTPVDTINFFAKLGITHKVEELGKVFPMSDQASSIIDVLLYELNELGVKIIGDAYVKDISKNKQAFVIKLENGEEYNADKVILTTGGKAMPSSGSDGNGYNLAIKFGHNITEVFPALVQLMLSGSFFKRIEGVKITGTAQVIYKNNSLAIDQGDILFGNYGVSGPPILQLSRIAGKLLNEGKSAYLTINMIDNMSKSELKQLITKRGQYNPNKAIDFSLVGLINKRLIPVVLAEAGINEIKRPVKLLTEQNLDALVNILTSWKFEIRGTKSWPSAQVTAGGIKTAEINSDTMESKLVEGLYLAGEIIDIDGQCGGFNLQWAWSSGFVAGQNAAL